MTYKERAIAEFEKIKAGAEHVRSMAATAKDDRGFSEMDTVVIHMEEVIETLRALPDEENAFVCPEPGFHDFAREHARSLFNAARCPFCGVGLPVEIDE